MPRFEHSRDRRSNRGPRDSYSSRDSGSFEDRPKRRRDSGRGFDRNSRGGGRDSGRGFDRNSRGGRDFQMTKVICSSCGDECEVPFKPTSSKPVYCSDCFSKQNKDGPGRRSSGGPSNKDLDMINEKLNKIMKALKIE